MHKLSIDDDINDARPAAAPSSDVSRELDLDCFKGGSARAEAQDGAKGDGKKAC